MTAAKAVVTGAGGGIGRAISLRLAQDGLTVYCVDLNAEAAAETADRVTAAGGVAVPRSLDITHESHVKELVEDIGPVTVLVNNAGVFRIRALADLTSDDVRRTLDVNLVAMFTLSRLVFRHMPPNGRIVNLASRAALGAANMADYVASKAAVVGLTRALALEFAAKWITVNAVAPGAIDTPMVRMRGDIDASGLVALQPIKRIGQPEDIAAAVSFLASRDASYITGQTLFVDGGRSLGALGV